METDPLRQVEELQRQRVEVYRSQATPAWAWPTFAVAVFLFMSSFELRTTWVAFVAPAVYAIFVGIWVGMITKRSGVQPRLRGMPRPLFAELVRFWVGGAVVAGVAVVLGVTVSFVLAGAVLALATVVGGSYYERRYRRQADALVAGSSAPAP